MPAKNTRKSTNTRLREAIRKHDLSRAWVASALKVDASTVDRWVVPMTIKGKGNPTHRVMPQMAMELLNYKVGELTGDVTLSGKFLSQSA